MQLLLIEVRLARAGKTSRVLVLKYLSYIKHLWVFLQSLVSHFLCNSLVLSLEYKASTVSSAHMKTEGRFVKETFL